MKAYLTLAAGTVFLSILCSILVPDGKLKKTVLFTLRMVCLAALIQPVYNLFSFTENESVDICDYSLICEIYSSQQEAAAEAEILNLFGENSCCEITIEYSDGDFTQTAIFVETESKNSEIILQIYEYLKQLDYINIIVE